MIVFIMAVCEGNDPRRRQPIRENLLVIRQRCRIVLWAGPTLSVEGGVLLSAAQVCLPKGSSDKDQTILHDKFP
jgi:hypothetical protein